MSLNSDLIRWLQDLQTAAGTRIHDEQVPQNVPMPFCATTKASGSQPRTLGGTKLFARATIRVGVFAESAVARDAITRAISDAVMAFTQTNPKGAAIGTTYVAWMRAVEGAGEVTFLDGDKLIKGTSLDISFMYRE